MERTKGYQTGQSGGEYSAGTHTYTAVLCTLSRHDIKIDGAVMFNLRTEIIVLMPLQLDSTQIVTYSFCSSHSH